MRGHVAQRPGGRWQVTVDLGPDPLTGHRRRKSATYDTQGQAENALPELLAQARTRAPAPKGLTVGELLDQWAAHIEADRSPNTMRGYRSRIATHLKPALGDLELSKLTAEHVDRLLVALARKKLSASMVREVHACLSGACRLAVRWRWLHTNPCAGATLPRAAGSKSAGPDLAAILAALGECSPDMADAAVLALATGARAGELCGLQWSDIAGDRVTFRRAVAHDGQVIVEHRKSKARTVTVDAATVAMLTGRHARAAADALACGVPLDGTGYVLAEIPGGALPLRPERVSGRWRNACARAGVAVRFHDLRHYSVTTLLAAGVSLADVARRHGHATPNVTLRVYAHAVESADGQAAEVMAAAVARAQSAR